MTGMTRTWVRLGVGRIFENMQAQGFGMAIPYLFLLCTNCSHELIENTSRTTSSIVMFDVHDNPHDMLQPSYDFRIVAEDNGSTDRAHQKLESCEW